HLPDCVSLDDEHHGFVHAYASGVLPALCAMKLISLSIPYLYLLHVLVISIRVGSTLLFAPMWGDPGLPQYLRVILVFSIAAGMSVVIPFNPQAYLNPGLILPTEFLIGMLLTMGIRIAFAG